MKSAAACLCMLGLALTFVGCASQRLQPGTGDLSFRLHWQGEADLDLHVKDPLDRHTGISMPGARGTADDQIAAMRAAVQARLERQTASPETAEPVGVLDIDCNASPTQTCTKPIENVFWPTGTAPVGRYTFWVHLFQPLRAPDDADGVRFRLEVRRGQTVVEVLEAVLDNETRSSEKFVFAY